jgi:hypothetical protein
MATDLVERPAAVPAPEEERDFPEVRVRRQFVVKRDGRDLVLYAGLVDALHALSEGYFELTTEIAQLPSAENGQTAVVTARVAIYGTEQRETELRVATGIGDASPANVSRTMAPHLIRMAETRAKARALRDLLNVAVASLEDEGPPAEERTAPPTPAPAPASPAPAPEVERILVNGRPYSREAVWDFYQRRRAQAREAGLVLTAEELGRQPDDPLPVLVGATQAIRKKLEGGPAGAAGAMG